MEPTKMHLGWFLGFTATDFAGPFAGDDEPWDGGFYVEMAKSLERAGFDYLLFEDTVSVPDAYGNSFNEYLRQALWVPKHDPIPLAAVITAATSHIGVAATMSTALYHPHMLARLAATVAHLSRGRFGWNIVTSGQQQAVRNFGIDQLLPHDERYDAADEYMEVVCKLWDSWEADNVIRDRESETYVAPDTVHRVEHAGKYLRAAGPLTTLRPPLGRPVFVQAGGSGRGREFAARYADSIISNAATPESMRAYRDDVRARAENVGRDPDEIKIFFVATPVLGSTTAEAEATLLANTTSERAVKNALAQYSFVTEIDFSQWDLDEVPPQDLTTNGERHSLEVFLQRGSGKTLRELALDTVAPRLRLVGTPDDVASEMADIIDEVGGDGFMISTNTNLLNRRYIAEVTDGLVPALRRLGRSRTAYTSTYLRDNLREF